MKVLITIKDKLRLNDLNNSYFDRYREADGTNFESRKYHDKSIGLQFIRDKADLKGFKNDKEYWRSILLEILDYAEFLSMEALFQLGLSFGEDDDIYMYYDYDLGLEPNDYDVDFKERILVAGDEELGYFDKDEAKYYIGLLERDDFFLIDKDRNIYIIVGGKLYLGASALYFTILGDRVLIANDPNILNEYGTPIYNFLPDTYELSLQQSLSDIIKFLIERNYISDEELGTIFPGGYYARKRINEKNN